jgi:hypothetical protein
MLTPQQNDVNDTIVLLVRNGWLIAYRDDNGAVRIAPTEWAAEHGLTDVALTVDQVIDELSAIEAEMTAKWN